MKSLFNLYRAMTSPLKRIESHPQEARQLIGIDYAQVLNLVALATERHQQKQTEIEQTSTRINAKGGGRKPGISIREGVCLCLVYLRQKPTFEILGLLFDISRTKANDTFHYWIDILRDILPASLMESVKGNEQKTEELRSELKEYELIVDSTEQPVARSVDYEEQKLHYSGKKKMHTLKNQFIVLPLGQDIVDITAGEFGKTSDITLFRQTQSKFDRDQKFLGDKAYQGEALAIVIPQKKPKNGQLTAAQKETNKQLSRSRMGVEHIIGICKIFRRRSEKFRLARHQYSKVFLTVCGLVRFRLNRLILRPFTTG